jgi:hypothetical protein
MVEDWTMLRQKSGDGWQRELFEGADFDAQAAKVLQQPEVLPPAGMVPGNWFITRSGMPTVANIPGWTLYFKGAGWDLYRSGGADAVAHEPISVAPTAIRFAGCKPDSK